jgi:hypothetical protein
MSQAPSPSIARCYGFGARCARLEGPARQRLSLSLRSVLDDYSLPPLNGAEPGDVLKVRLNKIVPRAYATNFNEKNVHCLLPKSLWQAPT